MSRTTAAASDFWSGAAPTTAAGFSMGVWTNPTSLPNDGQFMMIDKGSIDNNDFGLHISAVSTLRASTFGAGTAFAETTLPATSAWSMVGGVWAAANSRSVYVSSGIKHSDTGNQTPSDITGMHINGINVRNINGQYAHAFVALRALADIEWSYLFAGGSPRSLSVDHYWYLDQSATDNDKGTGSAINLTVHGTSAGSNDPVVASWWSAAALSNQAWTQGSAITSIDFSTKFENVHAAYTVSLKQLGAGSQTSTASGSAASASTTLTLASAAGVSAGDYVSNGSGGTKSLVLYVSSNTLLLATGLTWANADPIYRYPANTLTFTGPSISGNVLSGMPAAGDVGTYNNIVARATANSSPNPIADSPLFNITVAASGAAPTFTAGPTINATNTDGWTFGATPSATATWHIGAYLKGSTTPSVANIKAGTGTGFVAHVSKSISAADTQSLTGLTLPIYDVYHVLSNGSGDSAASSNLALLKGSGTSTYTPATIKMVSAATKANPVQVTVTGHGRSTGDWCQLYGLGGMVELNTAFAGKSLQCTVVDANTLTFPIDSTGFTTYTSGGNLAWGQSVGAAFSTAPATGDIWVIDTVTAEKGLPVTIQADGSISIAFGANTARQSFNVEVYHTSTGVMLGGGKCYFQDVPPIVQNTSPLPALFLPANQIIPTTSLTGFATDFQGDALLVAISGQPAGLSLSGTNLVGSTGASQIAPVTITYTNAATESNAVSANLVIGNVTVPNVVGQTQSIIEQLLANVYLTAAQPFPVQNDPNPAGPAPAGQAIVQSPAANSLVAPGTVVTVTLSSGMSTGTPLVGNASITKSTTLLAQEKGVQQALPPAQYVELGTCAALATDLPGQTYRFYRIPSSAIIQALDIQNDALGAAALCSIGVYLPNGKGEAVPGSSRILCQGLSLATPRNNWTPIYFPAVAGSSPSVANVTKRIWELLGLTQDPSGTQDVVYDVALTLTTVGNQGGSFSLRIQYLRGPDRGLITAAPVN